MAVAREHQYFTNKLSAYTVLMTDENRDSEISCPYCQSRDSAELSKHIDGVHAGLGLLEDDTRKYWAYIQPLSSMSAA